MNRTATISKTNERENTRTNFAHLCIITQVINFATQKNYHEPEGEEI